MPSWIGNAITRGTLFSFASRDAERSIGFSGAVHHVGIGVNVGDRKVQYNMSPCDTSIGDRDDVARFQSVVCQFDRKPRPVGVHQEAHDCAISVIGVQRSAGSSIVRLTVVPNVHSQPVTRFSNGKCLNNGGGHVPIDPGHISIAILHGCRNNRAGLDIKGAWIVRRNPSTPNSASQFP